MGPDLLENIHDLRRGGAGFQRALGGQLVDHAVGEGIGERNAEFNDIGPGAFEGPDQLGRFLGVGIARRDVGDEGLLAARFQLAEFAVDAIF